MGSFTGRPLIPQQHYLLTHSTIHPHTHTQQLSEQHGIDTYLHFIRRLIVHSQSRLTSSASPAAFDTSASLTFRLLVQETQRLARDPFLADRFRDGIEKAEGQGDVFRHFDLVRFADRVGLRPLERLVLASSIVASSGGGGSSGTGSSGTSTAGASPTSTVPTSTTLSTSSAAGTMLSTRKELASQAMAIVRTEFENAVIALCQHPSFDHADLSPAQVAKLMANLLSDPPADSPALDATQRKALVAAAQAKYGNEIVAPILHRIFPSLR
jgi:CCR4-NOT transcription complex subunit 1